MRLFLDASMSLSAAYADNSTASRLFGLQASYRPAVLLVG